jgi:DNA-binding protein
MVIFGKKSLPKNVVDHWPEVFNDVTVNAIPIEYLLAIKVTFNDGKKWEIKVKNNRKKLTNAGLEKTLNELFKNYTNSIKNVDFRLDTEKVKRDIEKRTKKFFKK